MHVFIQYPSAARQQPAISFVTELCLIYLSLTSKLQNEDKHCKYIVFNLFSSSNHCASMRSYHTLVEVGVVDVVEEVEGVFGVEAFKVLVVKVVEVAEVGMVAAVEVEEIEALEVVDGAVVVELIVGVT